MFTGLVEAVGTLVAVEARGSDRRFRIAAPFGSYALGESISVSGACLTVVQHDAQGFAADLSSETLARTTLGSLAPGSRVNLERSAVLGGRLGGHLVTGHVDAVARVLDVADASGSRRVRCELPADLARFVAEKGSITLDGVSLTVNLASREAFEVMLIPHTSDVTTLGDLAAGRRVNLEVDLIARYVVRSLEIGRSAAAHGTDESLTAALERAGYLG